VLAGIPLHIKRKKEAEKKANDAQNKDQQRKKVAED